MKLGPIEGYIVTMGGYCAPLKERRENTALDIGYTHICVLYAPSGGSDLITSFHKAVSTYPNPADTLELADSLEKVSNLLVSVSRSA